VTARSSDPLLGYALAIGKLFGNLASLDSLVRMALHVSRDPSNTDPSTEPLNLKVGDHVELNWITKDCTLGVLIGEYNKLQVERGTPENSIGDEILDLRNALAHGFISAMVVGGVLTLTKFGRTVKGGPLVVTQKVDLTPDWLQMQLGRVRDAVDGVHKNGIIGTRAEGKPG